MPRLVEAELTAVREVDRCQQTPALVEIIGDRTPFTVEDYVIAHKEAVLSWSSGEARLELRITRPPARPSVQAAQENSDVESPVLPSYSMPKALIRERFASAIVRSGTWIGWNPP
jgi:hypothetical protein